MDILVGNFRLAKTSGTETFTYALAVELQRRGHNVEYFTFTKGLVSSYLESNGIYFCSKKKYDLILANHNTVVDAVYDKGVTVQTCHGIVPELEQPSSHADAFVAISKEVQEHLAKLGFKSTVIWNAVDCLRFHPFHSVGANLRNVLSLCQSDVANDFIKCCCEALGIGFSQSNKYTDDNWSIEKTINEADLVVGVGRSLYDAMACGRAVLSFDYRSYGMPCGDGYLTIDNIPICLQNNCSGRTSKRLFTKEEFIRELKCYSQEDGEKNREFAQKYLNIAYAVDSYLSFADNSFCIKVKKFFQHWCKCLSILSGKSKLIDKFFKLHLVARAFIKGIGCATVQMIRKKPYINRVSRLSVNESAVLISNSLKMSDGSLIFTYRDSVYRRCDKTTTALLKIESASDWRLLFKDNAGNVYVSPHSSVSGTMNMLDRGLYRMKSGESHFYRVISLYNTESYYLKETESNDDAIWTMCEDSAGHLYAGVYAHTVRSNPAIYKSVDGGENWSVIYNFLSDYHEARHIHCITYDRYQDCLYCLVGEMNTLFKSVDGGISWQDLGLKTGGLFPQKCTVVFPTENGRILGSDGKYNCEIYYTEDDKKYKTVYQGWAGTVFGFRNNDLTGSIYAFTKIDASVTSQSVMPPMDSVINIKKAYSWLRCNVKERIDWLTYHIACRYRFPSDSVRPQSSAILVSQDMGLSWRVVYRAETGSEDNYGFWTAGTFSEGKCDFCLVAKDDDGNKNYVKTINIEELSNIK